MTNTPAPSIKSTAKITATASTFKPRVRRLGPGRYLVESATKPGRGHIATATHCSCVGFSYRHSCRHMTLVQSLEPSMAAWYGQTATTPAAPVMGQAATSIDNALDDADRRLGAAYRALVDAHEQSDERAALMRQVDELERQVAADNASAMRAA